MAFLCRTFVILAVFVATSHCISSLLAAINPDSRPGKEKSAGKNFSKTVKGLVLDSDEDSSGATERLWNPGTKHKDWHKSDRPEPDEIPTIEPSEGETPAEQDGDRPRDDTPAGKTARRSKIRYLLKAKEPMRYYSLKRDESDTESKLGHPNGTLKVLIHGFTPATDQTPEERVSHSKFFQIAEEYMESSKPDLNIIIVDWTELSTYQSVLYPQAAHSTRYAGKDVGEFLIRLVKLGLVSYDQTHIVGFSLGGHVSGVAGYTIKQQTGSKVGRITGIDPAGPLFSFMGEMIPDKRRVLDPTDAEFVDVIHCDMGSLLEGKCGTSAESGHVDFYPNGGTSQPKCDPSTDFAKGCSHNFCTEFFLRGIKQEEFVGCKCQSWEKFKGGKCNCDKREGAVMGERLDTELVLNNCQGKVLPCDMNANTGNKAHSELKLNSTVAKCQIT